jgi:AraC-like DNA-binding protein
MGRDALGFVCNRLDTASHRHFAVQLTVALDASFSVQLAKRGPQKLSSIIIPAEIRHSFVSFSGEHFFLLIDPLSQVGLRFAGQMEVSGELASLPVPLVDQIRSCARRIPPDPAGDTPYLEILSQLEKWSAGLPERAMDDRIVRAVKLCQRSRDKKQSLERLARSVHLSESWLVHLFKRETGVPVRRYLKWLRTLDAVRSVQAGKVSLTAAAHTAGFSDSAHLTRTFKEMFGVPPSLVFKK